LSASFAIQALLVDSLILQEAKASSEIENIGSGKAAGD